MSPWSIATGSAPVSSVSGGWKQRSPGSGVPSPQVSTGPVVAPPVVLVAAPVVVVGTPVVGTPVVASVVVVDVEVGGSLVVVVVVEPLSPPVASTGSPGVQARSPARTMGRRGTMG